MADARPSTAAGISKRWTPPAAPAVRTPKPGDADFDWSTYDTYARYHADPVTLAKDALGHSDRFDAGVQADADTRLAGMYADDKAHPVKIPPPSLRQMTDMAVGVGTLGFAPAIKRQFEDGNYGTAAALSAAELGKDIVVPELGLLSAGSYALEGLRKMLAPEADESRLGGAVEAGLSALGVHGAGKAVAKADRFGTRAYQQAGDAFSDMARARHFGRQMLKDGEADLATATDMVGESPFARTGKAARSGADMGPATDPNRAMDAIRESIDSGFSPETAIKLEAGGGKYGKASKSALSRLFNVGKGRAAAQSTGLADNVAPTVAPSALAQRANRNARAGANLPPGIRMGAEIAQDAEGAQIADAMNTRPTFTGPGRSEFPQQSAWPGQVDSILERPSPEAAARTLTRPAGGWPSPGPVPPVAEPTSLSSIRSLLGGSGDAVPTELMQDAVGPLPSAAVQQLDDAIARGTAGDRTSSLVALRNRLLGLTKHDPISGRDIPIGEEPLRGVDLSKVARISQQVPRANASAAVPVVDGPTTDPESLAALLKLTAPEWSDAHGLSNVGDIAPPWRRAAEDDVIRDGMGTSYNKWAQSIDDIIQGARDAGSDELARQPQSNPNGNTRRFSSKGTKK